MYILTNKYLQTSVLSLVNLAYYFGDKYPAHYHDKNFTSQTAQENINLMLKSFEKAIRSYQDALPDFIFSIEYKEKPLHDWNE